MIFICYRREDSGGHTGRLFDALEQQLGRKNVFRDIEDLEPGVDFVNALDSALSRCKALLVMIGPHWVSARGRKGRRLEQADDFVRMEVAAALQRKVLVIPVLVAGADMPDADELPEDLRGLVRHNAIELSDTRWDYDVSRLGQTLAKALGREGRKLHDDKRPVWQIKLGALTALVIVTITATLVAMNYRTTATQDDTSSTGELDVLEPSIKPAPGTEPLSRERVSAFVREFLEASEGPSIPALLEYYGSKVDYYAWGPVDKNTIAKDKRSFFQKWPEVNYEILSDIEISETGEPDTRIAIFDISFASFNPEDEKTNIGQARSTLTIRAHNGKLQVVDEKQSARKWE